MTRTNDGPRARTAAAKQGSDFVSRGNGSDYVEADALDTGDATVESVK